MIIQYCEYDEAPLTKRKQLKGNIDVILIDSSFMHFRFTTVPFKPFCDRA